MSQHPEHLRKKWDAAMAKLPPMSCGRLDISSFDASTGEMMKAVYVDGCPDPCRCIGPYCDEVAYAAGEYQRLVADNARLIESLNAIMAERDTLSDELEEIRNMRLES